MYPVSAAYMTAIGKPIKERRITGTIGTISFTDANIASGTLKIDNQCSSGTELELGSVYIGEMTCVFRGINLTGEWMGRTITISEELKVGETTWENVPLGIFHVVEALHQETGVYIVAYDVMDYLDKDWIGAASTGKPWDYMAYITQKTGVQFAQTQEQIQALPNGNTAFALYSENDISTYRDLLFWLAQLMCCFATATRDGKVVFRSYGTEAVDEIDGSARWEGSSFSDYETRYSAVSVTRLDNGYKDYARTMEDDALTYDLGANPFLQTGNTLTALGNILEALIQIAYTPFSVDRCGCPAYDLGDVLTFPDGIGRDRTGCMMSYEYDYHDVYMLDGYGANPALNGAQTKENKALAGLMSKSTANEVQYYTYTNAKEYEIRDDYQEIISIRFGSSKQTLVTFQTEIALEAEIEEEDVENIVNNIKYLWNNTELDYKPVETWIEGKHLLHLLYLIPIQEAAINTFKVRINSEGGVTRIGRAALNAVISGQGLVASTVWDGWIELEDEVTSITFRTTPSEVSNVSDKLTLVTHDPIDISVVSDNVVSFSFRTTPSKISDAEGEVYANKRRLADYTWEQVANEVIGAWDAYREDVTYYGGDLAYIETNGTRTEYRCTCGDGESTSGAFDAACWEVRTYNTWDDIYRLCAW